MNDRLVPLDLPSGNSFEPRNGSWNMQDTHNMLNYKGFAPSFANAEQLAPTEQFQGVTRQLPFLG